MTMNKLREQFEKECGWYPSEVDDRMDWRYIDEYREWLEQRLKANHHETFVMWRSVENEIPDDFIGVLVADKRGRIYLAEWDGGNFIQTAEGEYAYDITHWAPLPEPPQAT